MPRAYVDWTIRPATAGDARAVSEVLTAAALAASGEWLGIEGEPKVREWHGTTLREPRCVRDL